MDSYERILLVKPEVFVYRIPPRTTARGYRAADWNLDKPDWTLRMRIIAKDKACLIRLEDKTSGELFGECPVDSYPGSAVESVTDSSRYFVLRIQDPSGRSAFLGLGFADRSDSFDLNVSVQDHFKWVTTTEQIGKEEANDNKPKLDLAFKEGQMIKINIGKKTSSSTKSTASSSGSLPGLLPPPPSGTTGGLRQHPPPASSLTQNPASSQAESAPRTNNHNPQDSSGGLFDLDPLSSVGSSSAASAVGVDRNFSAVVGTKSASSDTSWMDF